ncbi:MAG TPA: 5-oxoprolinase subunit PxpB [Terrimicrobiaceae bacterium]
MDDVQVSLFGPRALLIRFAEEVNRQSLARCRGLLRSLEENPLEGLDDVTPAYCSVLLEFRDSKRISAQLSKLDELLKSAQALPPEEAPLHEISVCYDGPDIEELARRNRLSVSDVAELHALPIYNVFLIGFSPGFPYLGPLDPRLHVPRLDSPRSRVPVGSVAIGGEHTGIYSVASPGGWWLIGRTDRELFSLSKAREAGSREAFLLRQGDLVKFQAVGDLPSLK